MTPRGATVVGVDVGGTFTDVFYLDQQSGACGVAKVSTTPQNQAEGFAAGIGAAVGDPAACATVVHGTTIGTNALIERKGARTGVITTRGFRDVLEMRRRDRPRTWGLWGRFEPVVSRELRLEVNERTLADGSIDTPLDPAEVRAAATSLLAAGAQTVGIFFINAYANDANERAALAAVREVWPNDHVNISSELLPEIREFERASTTVLNAYLQPLIGDYLHSLDDSLRGKGFTGEILIVQSNGGVMSVASARRNPIRTALSGPAVGVIAGAHIAAAAGYANAITCDMGGTSFDVSLIAAGKTTLSAQTAIDFGLVVRTPMIEITTIGAGGGSIAWVDRGGLLQVGPESAGAEPGPACYGLGSDRPTVTDANVTLGRIDAHRPIGGRTEKLHLEAARAAIDKHVGRALDLDTMAAAEAVIRIANSRMAGAIRLVSIERGHDPRQFVAMPFGGSGPLHAGALIREVGLAKALVPRYPGATSALGCVIADMRHDFVHTVNTMLDDLDAVALEGIDRVFELDMLYVGQTHAISVPLPLTIGDGSTGLDKAIVRDAFESSYRRIYGRLLEGIAMRIVSLRVAVIGRRPKLDVAALAPQGGSVEAARRAGREVWIDGGWQQAEVFDRLAVPVGAVIAGPAVLEQPDATTFVDPGLVAEVDRCGNLIVAPSGAEALRSPV